MKLSSLFSLFLLLTVFVNGQLRNSALNSDPEVVYQHDFTDEIITLKVTDNRKVFSSRSGSRALGRMKLGSTCQLIGFDQRAFKVKGTAEHAGVTGWVSPKAFAEISEKDLEEINAFYDREMTVRELIRNGEIAIGMTPQEIQLVKGEPTKTKVRTTATGTAGEWEYLIQEEIKHYDFQIDPFTGQTIRRLSHITFEVSERTIIEFKDGSAISIEEEKANDRRSRRRIIVHPLVLNCW